MTQVHFVKKARKAYREESIKKGDSYYWWKFRHSAKIYSKEYPKQSQLTQSSFYQSLYSLQDEISNLSSEEGLKETVEDIISRIEELRDEQEEKKENMPEQLQESDTGNLLQERYDSLDDWINELQNIYLEEDGESKDEIEECRTRIIEEIQSTEYSG